MTRKPTIDPPPRGMTTTRRLRRDAMPVYKGSATPIIRVEPDLGMKWWWSLQIETLGRNLATAGGLEFAFRLGLSHDAVRRAGRRR